MTQPKVAYTAQLQAGLGMLAETRALLELWQPGMDRTSLNKVALQSGRFPNVSARRLQNIVGECFAPRYLVQNGAPAMLLKTLQPTLSGYVLEQLMFLYTCRATAILADYVREVYWHAYTAGRPTLSFDEAHDFVTRANQDGKTRRSWSLGTVKKNAGYLNSCCADFGLLERGKSRLWKILHYQIDPQVAIILAYDLHFAGLGDNQVVNPQGMQSHAADWALFGLDSTDVLNELKRLALKGVFIVQAAGGVTRISWQYKNREELADALTTGQF